MAGRRRRHPALDLQTPFFRPVWRRVAVLVVIAIWVVIELTRGSIWWAALAGGIGVYAAYEFFVAFDPVDPEADDTDDRGDTR